MVGRECVYVKGLRFFDRVGVRADAGRPPFAACLRAGRVSHVMSQPSRLSTFSERAKRQGRICATAIANDAKHETMSTVMRATLSLFLSAPVSESQVGCSEICETHPPPPGGSASTSAITLGGASKALFPFACPSKAAYRKYKVCAFVILIAPPTCHESRFA